MSRMLYVDSSMPLIFGPLRNRWPRCAPANRSQAHGRCAETGQGSCYEQTVRSFKLSSPSGLIQQTISNLVLLSLQAARVGSANIPRIYRQTIRYAFVYLSEGTVAKTILMLIKFRMVA